MEFLDRFKKISIKYLYPVAVVLCVLCVSYIMISIFTKTPLISEESKHKLDSLQVQIDNLNKRQLKYDSLLFEEQAYRASIDQKIKSIEDRKLIIREYYREVSKQVDSYNTKQVDSFFRARYGY